MNDAIRHPFAGRNWLLYASVERLSEDLTREFLDSWLSDKLHLLALPDSLFEKVNSSACDAVEDVPAGISRVCISVFTPSSHALADQTWGFFRMVKNSEIPEDPQAEIVEIVFYLYAEGSAKRS